MKTFRCKCAWFLFFISIVIGVAAHQTVKAEDTLRFGVLPVVDTLPLLVGQEEGLFAREKIVLDLVPFQSALERDAALQAGKLGGYFGDILNTVLLIQIGQPLKIITTSFHTHPQFRMFGIVAAPKSTIDNLIGLKDKQVAISRATVIEYLLDRILMANGQDSSYVQKLEIKKIPIRLQMLLSNQVAAALLPEPLLTLAEAKGARVVADDRQLNTTETVLALDSRLMDKKPTLATRFLRAYSEAVSRINKDPESYKTLLVTRTRFPMPIKDKYQVPQFPKVGLPSVKDVNDAQNWLRQNGLQKRPLAYEAIVFKSAR
jgi:NitT/TauT family transport system substrate-binding protein